MQRCAPEAVVRPGSEKINSATAVFFRHAPHRTKKGQNGLETQSALSRLEALEEGSVRQSVRQAEGLPQQGAPPLGLGSVGQVDAFQAGAGCRATEGDADIPRDHNAVGRAVGQVEMSPCRVTGLLTITDILGSKKRRQRIATARLGARR
jgi:hypothetical protein